MSRILTPSQIHNKYIHGVCQDYLPLLPDGCADMIYGDLPWGYTRNSWDKAIPFDYLWPQYMRIAKPDAAIIVTGLGTFSAKAILSNEKYYRYTLVWQKGDRTTGFLNANRQPLRNHEDMMVFYRQQPVYNPQMTEGEQIHSSGRRSRSNKSSNYGAYNDVRQVKDNLKYPKSIWNYPKPHPAVHPTQKPVPLMEDLIKTYTNPGALILDITAGIGTTCKGAENTGRNYFAVEKRKRFYEQGKIMYNL